MLEKRENFLMKKAENELSQARKFTKEKNKRAALMCLKRKKKYEEQVSRASDTRMALEQQVMALEGANVNVEVVQAMKGGSQALKSAHAQLNVDKVDNLMDDIREEMDKSEEISQAIAQPLGSDMIDEDELNAELEQLEQEEMDNQLLDIKMPSPAVPAQRHPSISAAPAVPSRQPARAVAVEEDPDERELRELEASMAM